MRYRQAPADFLCPYRHACPHLEGLSSTWTLSVFQALTTIDIGNMFRRNMIYTNRGRFEALQRVLGVVLIV